MLIHIRPLFVEHQFLIPRPHGIMLPHQVQHYAITCYCACADLFWYPCRRSLTTFFCQSLKCTTLMLNFTVYNRSDSRTLVSWRIHGVNPPDISFLGFYHNEATRFIEGGSAASRLELQSTFVGAS